MFLIRDDEFTEALPDEIKDAFVDDNTLCTEKMKKLKEMLTEHFPVCMLLHIGGGGGRGRVKSRGGSRIFLRRGCTSKE